MAQKEPSRHHYLPRLLLRKFVNSSGNLWGYDALEQKKFPTSPKAAGVEVNFHSIKTKTGEVDRTTIEEIFDKQIERPGNVAIGRLIKRETLTDEQAGNFMRFVAAQFVRTPEGLAQRSALVAPVLQESLERMAKFDKEFRRRVTKELTDRKYSQDKIDALFKQLQNGKVRTVPTREFLFRLMLQQINSVAKQLCRLGWRYCTLDDADPDLVIGDHPVTLQYVGPPGSSQRLGLANLNVELAIPLGRRTVAIAEKGARTYYALAAVGTAKDLNDGMMRAAHRFVYASVDSDELLKRFIRLHGTGPKVRTMKMQAEGRTMIVSEFR